MKLQARHLIAGIISVATVLLWLLWPAARTSQKATAIASHSKSNVTKPLVHEATAIERELLPSGSDLGVSTQELVESRPNIIRVAGDAASGSEMFGENLPDKVTGYRFKNGVLAAVEICVQQGQPSSSGQQYSGWVHLGSKTREVVGLRANSVLAYDLYESTNPRLLLLEYKMAEGTVHVFFDKQLMTLDELLPTPKKLTPAMQAQLDKMRNHFK
jgi:hypothetical protein